jgi:hypothetical protein
LVKGAFFYLRTKLKKSFSLLELIFVIILISILLATTLPKKQNINLEQASKRIITYLKFTRYLAMIDNKYKLDEPLWFKERWTLKFQNCAYNVGGLYFVVFSDKNQKGSPNKDECAKDPLSDKYLYSHYDCVAGDDESETVLLTKKYGVEKVTISCNSTNTLGSISFDINGEAHSRLGTDPDRKDQYKLNETCYIELFDKEENSVKIAIEAKTGFIHRVK